MATGAAGLAGAFGGDLAGVALLLVTGRVAAFVRVALGLAAVLAAGGDFAAAFAGLGAGFVTGFGAGLRAAAFVGLGAGAALRGLAFAAGLAAGLAGFRAAGAARLGAGRGTGLAAAFTGLALAAGFLTGVGAFLARADEGLLRGDVAMCDETPATQRGGSRMR